MSFILYCDHTIPLHSVSDIFLQLTEKAITKPDTNIRLAWGAVTLGNRLLVSLCQCLKTPCTCATHQTTEILKSLKTTQALIYCREQAWNRNSASVLQQYAIHSTCFARYKARKLYPLLIEGELGIITAHCTAHGDLMAIVNFPTHGTLEIPAELTFIHPLEAREHWTNTGPGFTLGDKITTLEGPAIFGVVHGFVTQSDSSLVVLIWFNETDKYMQLRPDQIQLENTALSPVKIPEPPPGHLNTGQTCLSGCTLLANSSGGIQMREVRPGTFLLNAKGKEVRVTNVYFSRESTVMVQISAHCHATITHPMVDTKGHGRWNRGRRSSAKTIVKAAEWYTRRRHNIYRSTPMGSLPLQPLDHQAGHNLHPSSPQNLRKSGDMCGFSTEHNQLVRGYDDSFCLICPIGHIGWTQVDIATAIFSCWGRTRHLPDPRPDLTEFQEQTEAIHAFLSSPEAVKKLEKKQMLTAPEALSPRNKQPIEFTNGHIQLEWIRGSWFVQNWKDRETVQPLWIVRCIVANSDESYGQTRLKIGSRHCTAAFFLQVPKSCTDLDPTILCIWL